MPYAAVLHICLSFHTISSTRVGLTSVIQALLRPLRLMSITLFLPDEKMLVRLSTRCPDVTSVRYEYNSERCRWVSADDTFCTHTNHVTPTSKRDQFSKVGHRVELPQLCPFCAYASNYRNVSTKILCHKCSLIQNDGLNFVRLFFFMYTVYVNDLHNILKRRS
jgi:hypothetical protein